MPTRYILRLALLSGFLALAGPYSAIGESASLPMAGTPAGYTTYVDFKAADVPGAFGLHESHPDVPLMVLSNRGGSTPPPRPGRATAVNRQTHHLHEVYYMLRHNTYDHGARLTDWLDAGMRAVEIDVVDRGWGQDPNGPYVSHGGGEGNRNCSGNPDRLGHCLVDVQRWLTAHPGEGPILVFVDLKTTGLGNWGGGRLYDLDQLVARTLGSTLYTSNDLYRYASGVVYAPGTPPLRQAVSQRGWPRLADLGNRVLVLYTGGVLGFVNQTQAGGVREILSRSGGRLPNGFFCPNVELEPDQLEPGRRVDGMTGPISQLMVCSNLAVRDHYQVVANTAARHNQLIHLYTSSLFGAHVFRNHEYPFNYIAVAHGISAIGRDDDPLETFGGSVPLVGVRRSLPGYFELRPLHAPNRCADARGGGTGNGVDVILYGCHGGRNQRFVYTAEGQLRPGHINTKCLDIEGGNAQNGKKIHLWDCDGGDSEKWRIQPNGTFRSFEDAAFCLDVSGGSPADGTAFITYGCQGNPNQRFRLAPVSDWPQRQF